MNRYRSYGAQDDQPQVAGDQAFLGVNEYDVPQNLQPGEVQKAVNIEFKTQAAETRGGFVCLPELGIAPFEINATWTSRTTPQNKAWQAVTYGNGRFVALQNDETGVYDVMYSTDGVTWLAVSSGIKETWSSITYGNGTFVAVSTGASGNRLVTSGGLNFVTSSGDTMIAADAPYVMTSADGTNWTAYQSAGDFAWSSVTYGNGLFVAVANGDGGSTQVMTSPDGVTWTLQSTPASQANHNWRSVVYGNGKFVAVASGGTGSLNRAMYSTNGTTWVAATTPATPANCVSVAYGDGLFIAVANTSATATTAVWTSDDGITWTARTTPGAGWTAITFGNALFTAVGNTTVAATSVMTSTDGITWTARTAASGNLWSAAAFGGNTFVAVSTNGSPNQVMTAKAVNSVWATGIYSDPADVGTSWIMLLGTPSVGFYASGKTSRTVSLNGHFVTEQSTIVQANNYVYIFRGDNATPLYWDGNWNNTFDVVPNTTLPSSFNSIPNSNQATYYQNRLWVKDGKDEIAASDVLAFTDYDPLANEFNLNTGNSDYLVATFPFGQNALVAFKNKSVLLLQNVEGSLSDVTVTEITRQVGLVGINAVCSVGPDLAYASNRNINLLTLTNTNNALQHKTLPLSAKIRRIMDKVNWNYSSKISMGYWNNRLYVALPIDNSTVCNCVVVYNFITQAWCGEWSFASSINMCIQSFQVVDYVGLQRMHAITEDGRIFVTDEGQNDISGSTVAEISTELVTRAYMTTNLNHFQRRMFADISSNRPSFSVAAYTEGANEESVLLTNQTYNRSQSWLFNDDAYDLTNANNDYNRAYRKDYSTGPDNVQTGTGFLPEMTQEQRLPLITRRQGRLSWLKITNTQGLLSLRTLGYETRPGTRANLTQV